MVKFLSKFIGILNMARIKIFLFCARHNLFDSIPGCSWLYSFFNPKGIIKIEAQGAEGLIMEWAAELIKRNNLKILMEFWPFGLKNLETNPKSLLETLKDFGFNIRALDDKEDYEGGDVEKIVRIAESKVHACLFLYK